jgi:hypothetical protein
MIPTPDSLARTRRRLERRVARGERELLAGQLDFRDLDGWNERPTVNPGHHAGARSDHDHEEADSNRG